MRKYILIILGIILLTIPHSITAQSSELPVDWVYFIGADASIYRVQINGENLQQLTDDVGQEESMFLSPDKTWMIGLTYREGSYNIYRMRPDGTEFALLTNSPDIERKPVWSLNGQFIFYTVENEKGVHELRSLKADGSTVTTLLELSDLHRPEMVGWSADGEWLLLEDNLQTLYRVHPDGTDLEEVLSKFFIFGYQYSPSRSQFGYVSLDENDIFSIHIRSDYNMDGEHETIYAVDVQSGFVWSLDEQTIYFTQNTLVDSGLSSQLYQLDIASEEVSYVVGPDFAHNISVPAMTSDGKWLVFTSEFDETSRRLHWLDIENSTMGNITDMNVLPHSDILLYTEESEG